MEASSTSRLSEEPLKAAVTRWQSRDYIRKFSAAGCPWAFPIQCSIFYAIAQEANYTQDMLVSSVEALRPPCQGSGLDLTHRNHASTKSRRVPLHNPSTAFNRPLLSAQLSPRFLLLSPLLTTTSIQMLNPNLSPFNDSPMPHNRSFADTAKSILLEKTIALRPKREQL